MKIKIKEMIQGKVRLWYESLNKGKCKCCKSKTHIWSRGLDFPSWRRPDGCMVNQLSDWIEAVLLKRDDIDGATIKLTIEISGGSLNKTWEQHNWDAMFDENGNSKPQAKLSTPKGGRNE